MAKVHPIIAACVLPDNLIAIGANYVTALRVEPSSMAGFYLLTIEYVKPVDEGEPIPSFDRFLVSPATIIFQLGEEEERPDIAIPANGRQLTPHPLRK